MVRVQKKLVTIVVMLFAVSLFADTNSVLNVIRKKYGENSYVDMEFDLTIFWAIREKYEKKSGKLTYAPDDNFYLKLGHSTWISNGQTYWQYSDRTNQVVIKGLLDVDVSMHPSSMLKNFLKKSFKQDESNEKEIVLTFASNDKKSNYKKITLRINKKRMEISELVTVDSDQNESRYVFKKVKLGEKPSPAQFEFTIPQGADILDTRK